MSSRRNQDRVGAPNPDTSPHPALATTEKDSIFSFVVPTEFVELPSGGEFYPESHPLCGKTTLEIRHMTAKEEDILTSESLLRRGVAIDRLLQSLILDRSVIVHDLLIGDKNALIIAARITGFGEKFTTKVRCTSCKETQDTDFDLGKLTIRNPEIPDNVEQSEENTFFVKLPLSGITVELRLMTGRHEQQYINSSQKRKKKKMQETTSTDLLKLLVISADGHDDVVSINKFISILPLRDSLYIKDTYEKISPDVDLTQDFECETCGHEGGVGVPLNADFFWPQR